MAMDPVNKKALKKDFDDRADKDIDNDGDTDSSDEYLHKRRKAVAKAISKVKESVAVFESHFKVGDEVECIKSGMEGKVIEVDPEEKGKYYTVKREDGKIMKYAPDELRAEDEDEDEEDEDEDEDEMDEAWKKDSGWKKPTVHKDRYGNVIKTKNVAKSLAKGAAKKSASMKEDVDLDEAKADVYHKHMLKALGKSRLPKNHQYTSAIANNGDFVVKDGGGRTVGRIAKGEHNLKEAKAYGPGHIGAIQRMLDKERKGKAPRKVSPGMEAAAKELEMYARKSGGIDKGDFMKAVMMMKKGQKNQLNRFVDDLDTEPREKILSVMQKHLREGVELDEISRVDYKKHGKTFVNLRKQAQAKVDKEIASKNKSTKKEEVELDEKVYASDYNVGHEKSKFGGYRPHITHKKTGHTMYLGATSYKKPEHAKGHAAAYLKGYEQIGDRTANRMANEYEKANKKHVYKESVELEEKLSVSDGMGAWIDDFKKSDAPQFKGKDDKERREMAIAAYLAAKRKDK
jgi:hypothetical protein